MSTKFIFLNILLIGLVGLLFMKNYEEVTRPKPAEKEGAPSKQKTAPTYSVASISQKGEAPARAVYDVISQKNIFHPERKEFPIILPPDPAKKAATRPNLTLFGVAMGESFQSALINNPTRRADKGERETMSVKVGDRVGEYTVKEIQSDRITLESSGDSFDILLYDPSRQKKRPVFTPPPPTVRPPGPSPTPTPTPTPTPSPVPPRPFPRSPGGTAPTPVPPPGSVVSPTPSPGTFSGRSITRGRTEPRRVPAPSTGTPRPSVPEQEDDDDDEI